MFLDTCLLLLGCQFCWHIIVHSIALWFFVFLWYQLLCLLFHLFFFSVLFSFGEPGQRFVKLAYSFKESDLGFPAIFKFLFISSLIFIIFFLLLTFSFYLFVCLFFFF